MYCRTVLLQFGLTLVTKSRLNLNYLLSFTFSISYFYLLGSCLLICLDLIPCECMLNRLKKFLSNLSFPSYCQNLLFFEFESGWFMFRTDYPKYDFYKVIDKTINLVKYISLLSLKLITIHCSVKFGVTELRYQIIKRTNTPNRSTKKRTRIDPSGNDDKSTVYPTPNSSRPRNRSRRFQMRPTGRIRRNIEPSECFRGFVHRCVRFQYFCL